MSDAKLAEAWHNAGVAIGGTSIEDPPGVRPNALISLIFVTPTATISAGLLGKLPDLIAEQKGPPFRGGSSALVDAGGRGRGGQPRWECSVRNACFPTVSPMCPRFVRMKHNVINYQLGSWKMLARPPSSATSYKPWRRPHPLALPAQCRLGGQSQGRAR